MKNIKILQGYNKHNMKVEVIDNYLNKDIFQGVYNTIHSQNYNWNLWKRANENAKEEDYQFAHTHINQYKEIDNINLIFDILKPYTKKIKKDVKILRAKTNLFIRQSTNRGLGFHRDIDNSNNFKTLLLYLETSNGYTEFKNGEKIASKENRALIFNANETHQTVTQTDTLFRTNININFEEIYE